MAYIDFYNLNANRFYPLVVPVSGEYPLSGIDLRDDLIVDCGFTFGTASGFDVELHSVWLDHLETVGDNLKIVFKTDAPDIADKSFEFVRYKDAEVGEVEFIELDGDPRLAIGFLVTDNVFAMYDFIGSDSIVEPPQIDPKILVEPATIVSEYRHNITTLNVGNISRITSDNCCDDPSPIDDETVILEASGLTGAIFFEAGYNMNVAVSGIDNTITFTPGVGDGKGVYCGDAHPLSGVKCGDLIYNLSGVLPADNGAMTVSVSNGFTATLEPDLHKITILSKLETEIFCEEE